MLLKALVFLFVLIPLTTSAKSKLPLSEFLKISEQGRHREVLMRAGEVLPSERNTDWEKAVSTSSKAFISTVEAEADREWAFAVGKSLIIENPHLEKDAELMMSMGDLAVKTYSTKGVATPFYVKGMKKADARCSDESIQTAVNDAFTRPGFEKEKTAAADIAFNFCSSSVTEDWAKAMLENENALKTACPGLLKLGKLSGVKKTKCERAVKGDA